MEKVRKDLDSYITKLGFIEKLLERQQETLEILVSASNKQELILQRIIYIEENQKDKFEAVHRRIKNNELNIADNTKEINILQKVSYRVGTLEKDIKEVDKNTKDIKKHFIWGISVIIGLILTAIMEQILVN